MKRQVLSPKSQTTDHLLHVYNIPKAYITHPMRNATWQFMLSQQILQAKIQDFLEAVVTFQIHITVQKYSN